MQISAPIHKKLFALCISALCTGAALILLIQAGLPDRTTYSGQFIEGIGYIAPEENAIAPVFADTTLNNETIALADFAGQPVIVNFWATWCAPCLIELPILQSIHEDYQNDSLQIIGINMGENPDYLRDWIATQGLNFAMIVDEDGSHATQYRLRGNPSTYMIAPDGTITRIFYGPADEHSLRSVIATWLEE
ncbi:MAG: TlpA family protein disulfide reductase [Aggregatilineales bacterium]